MGAADPVVQTPAESPWLTLEEAAAYAKYGKRLLARQVNAGRLRAARLGDRGRFFFRREWIDEWRQAHMKPLIAKSRVA